MKAKLFFISACVIINCNIHAQSFELYDLNNLKVNNGDTIVVVDSTFNFMTTAAVSVKNISNQPKDVNVIKQDLTLAPGATTAAFAWGLIMYAPFVYVSSISNQIPAGVTDQSFFSWYFDTQIPGASFYRYTFYDVANLNDSAHCVIQYNIIQATAVDVNENEVNVVIQNPVYNNLQLSLPFESGTTEIAIHDVSGHLIYSTNYSGKQLQISTSAYAGGVYFIALINKGKIHRQKFLKI